MSYSLLVEAAGGMFVRKAPEELQPSDRVVFDGPNTFDTLKAAQRALDDEIEAAGGLDAWRAAGSAGQ